MARAKTAAEGLPSDRRIVEANFARGIVRDSDVPVGGLYDALDWMVDQPGTLYKRGGWERHSLAVGGTHVIWVGTLHIPPRVVCIDNAYNLYDVTSENSPSMELIGNIGFAPKENSPTSFAGKEMLIVTDALTVNAPKVVRFDQTTSKIVFEPMPKAIGMGTNPPVSTYSCFHNGFVVLARGGGDYNANTHSRVWFGLSPYQITGTPDGLGLSDWDVSLLGNWVDTSHEVTGLASVGGVLLVFSPNHVQRITGSLPFGNLNADMTLAPFANVGTIDARSIVTADENIIFAGEEGVWITNGSGLESLTSKPDGTGIQTYWRSLFPRQHLAGEHNFRQLIGGMMNRDFYLICILDHLNNHVECLLCYVPARTWVRLTNFGAMSMAHGHDERDIGDLYWASAHEPYVNRAMSMLYPQERNKQDGNELGPNPSFISRNLGADNPGLKAYGFGWLSYTMKNAKGTSLSVGALTGLRRSRPLTKTSMGATDSAGAIIVDRQRFSLFTDSQALWMEVVQHGDSELTEIDYLELEERAYPGSSDSLGR